MVYFIWSSSFTIAEQSLPSQLSAATGSGTPSSETPPPPEADFEDVVVRILWQGSTPTWTVNESPVPSLAALKQSLAQVARIKRDAPVILHPDPDVPLGNVIEVYDLSRIVGFEKIQFAVTP
jgi:biopolymer transport protein ExbD